MTRLGAPAMQEDPATPSDTAPDPVNDHNTGYALEHHNLADRLRTFEATLRAHAEGAGQDDFDLFVESNHLADELLTSLQSVQGAERTDLLLSITDRLHALLPTQDQQTSDSTEAIDSAIRRVAQLYVYQLDPETIPMASLRQLTRISVFCDLGGDLPGLAEAMYRRDHNDLFGNAAPDFVRDRRFTSTLLDTFLRPHLDAVPRPTPSELMLSGREVGRATELHLMAYGFSAPEAATITSLWGTLWQSTDGSTARTFRALINNLDTLGAVERIQPGLALRLFRERGVAHFGRYPEELLLQQFEPLPEGVKPDFMLLAHDDHNAALSETVEILVDSLGLEDLKGLRIAEVDSPEELVRLTGVLAQQFGPALNLVIGGHGEEDAVMFGPEYVGRTRAQTALRMEQIEQQLTGLVQFILPDGSVLLVSCSTGAKGAISGPVATILDRSVQAPAVPSNITHVQRDAGGRMIANFHDNAGRTVLPGSMY